MPTTATDPNAVDPNDPTRPRLTLAGQPPATPPIPAPTVAAPSQPVDRLSLAKSNFDTFANQTAPAYDASLRSAAGTAAGLGQLGSGQFRTSVGDLTLARQRDLDTERSSLVNAATEGSIADASTAYQQALSSAQQGLAAKLGEGNLNIAQQSADTQRAGTLGGLDVAKGQLQLATGEATGTVNGTQTLAAKQADMTNALATAGLTGVFNGTQTLAAKEQAVNAAVAAGHLTVEQGQLALSTLANSQQNTLETGKLQLAQRSEADQNTLAKAGLDITKLSADTAAKAEAAMEKYQSGQLTLAQRDETLKELANTQQNTLATGNLALAQKAEGDTATNQAGQLQLAKDTLAQQAAQFGLSQDQQLKLAQLSDATANRSIDASTAQGRNQILAQLAALVTQNGSVNNTALVALAKQFGIDASGGVVGSQNEGEGANRTPPP